MDNAKKSCIDIQADFDQIYISYFFRMLRFAREYVLSDEDAENIVQDIFVMLWERKGLLMIKTNLSSYLFSLVKNRCLDFLRHQSVVEEYRLELAAKLLALEQLDHAFQSDEDIEHLVMSAIEKLPERCREIFIKSRVDGKKYREIAEELNLSINTVENQISIAIKKLKIELKDYLFILLPFFIVK